MYATGLKHALSVEDKSTAECAIKIDRTVKQIERWLEYHDKVTPEMQDRLVTLVRPDLLVNFLEIVYPKKHLLRHTDLKMRLEILVKLLILVSLMDLSSLVNQKIKVKRLL
ncbi:MAG: hypothetical protein GQ542_20045 [Desulforhopalus sp.]|nr:hypothetical protein [Desulforhopalus sp.]